MRETAARTGGAMLLGMAGFFCGLFVVKTLCPG
jgi:hypothetical protein